MNINITDVRNFLQANRHMQDRHEAKNNHNKATSHRLLADNIEAVLSQTKQYKKMQEQI